SSACPFLWLGARVHPRRRRWCCPWVASHRWHKKGDDVPATGGASDVDDARVVAGWPMIRNRARSAISDAAPPVAGDAELYARLIADRFTGPVYERVMDRLCRYGYTTIHAWVTSGLIFSRCAEKRVKGLPAGETWSNWTKEDIEDLVQDAVAGAELRFRSDGLRGTGWRFDGGASLGGYFITGCLFAFASAYKRRRRDRGRHYAA